MAETVARVVYSLILVSIILFSSLGLIFNFEDTRIIVEAKEIIVDCNGFGNHTTIQAAINAANPGDTIYVWNGTYNEDIIVNKSISLIGNGTKNTTIIGTGKVNVILVTANYVNISGFTVTGSGVDPVYSRCGGIKLNGVTNCTIKNNNCSNNENGICINVSHFNTVFNNTCNSNNWSGIRIGAWPVGSNNNIVTNNTCILNLEGIDLFYSNLNIIENNTYNSNIDTGIRLSYSDLNTISRNNCISNKYWGINIEYSYSNLLENNICDPKGSIGGILIRSSDYNYVANNSLYKSNNGIILYNAVSTSILNNTMISCGLRFDGWTTKLQYWDSHIIDENNTVNGKPLYYWKYVNGSEVPLGAGQIFLVKCENITVENHNISNVSVGISLGFSKNITIKNNNLSNNIDGLELWSSSSCTIANNTCNSNFNQGILAPCSNLIIENNTCNSNFWGMYIGGYYNLIKNNICNNNCYKDQGGCGLYCYGKYSLIFNNTCNSNDGYGIFYSGYQHMEQELNEINNNTCNFNNHSGIYIDSGESNLISNNTCNFNKQDGIIIFSEQYGHGTYGKKNIVRSNTCNNNYQNGINFAFSILNTALDNICTYNKETGIGLYGWFYEGEWTGKCEYNLIYNNTCKFNSENGILLQAANNNEIIKNSNLNNGIGVKLNYSKNNIISENTLSFNSIYGIMVNISLGKNTIYHNNFINNSEQAIDNENNYWSGGKEGNYWSDYTGLDNGSNGRIKGDGIGDTEVPHLELDDYPFVKPWGWLYPGTPFLICSNNIDSDGNYTLYWNETARTTEYVLQENTNETFDSPTEYNASWDFIQDQYIANIYNKIEGTFYYRIKAYNDQNYGEWSNFVNVTVDYPPPTPRNLTVLPCPEGNAVKISWDLNLKDTIEYCLYYKLVIAEEWKHIANITHPINTYYKTNLYNNLEFSFRICAKDDRGQLSGFSPTINAIPKDLLPPSPPTGLKITNITSYSVTIVWNKSIESDVLGYNIYRSQDRNHDSWGKPVKTIVSNNTKFINEYLNESTTYYYVITAFDSVPNESNYSNMISVTTLIGPREPQINNSIDDFEILEDTLDDSTINLYSWFKDLNNDPLIFECIGNKHINVTIYQENGTVILNPEKNWNGQEELTFLAKDKDGKVFDDVQITVLPVNDPPMRPEIILPDNGTIVNYNDSIDFEGICDDPDLVYGDKLTFTWSSNLSGVIGIKNTLTGIYLPPGSHLITLVVSDKQNLTSQTTINITVMGEIITDKNDTEDGSSKSPKDGDKTAIIVASIIMILIIIIIIIWFIVIKKKLFKIGVKKSELEEPKKEKELAMIEKDIDNEE